jgi:simple sugar transport system ATP-binding protein
VLADGRLSRAVPAEATSVNQIGVWMSGDFDYHGADHVTA